MDLLPEMSTEDLDQGDLQRRDLAVHENTGQIQLHLSKRSFCRRSSSSEAEFTPLEDDNLTKKPRDVFRLLNHSRSNRIEDTYRGSLADTT